MKFILVFGLLIFAFASSAQKEKFQEDTVTWINYQVKVHVTDKGVLEVEEVHDFKVNGNIFFIRRLFDLPKPGSITSMKVIEHDITEDTKEEYVRGEEIKKGNYLLSSEGLLKIAIRSPDEPRFQNKILHFSLKYTVTNTFEKTKDHYIFRFPFFVNSAVGLSKTFSFDSTIDEKAWKPLELIPKAIQRNNVSIADPYNFMVRLQSRPKDDVEKVFALNEGKEYLFVCSMVFDELTGLLDALLPGTPANIIKFNGNKSISMRLVVTNEGFPWPLVSTYGPDAYAYVVPGDDENQNAMDQGYKHFFNENYAQAKDQVSRWLGAMAIGATSHALVLADKRALPLNLHARKKDALDSYDMRLTEDKVSIKVRGDQIIMSELETQMFQDIPIPKSFKYLLQSSFIQGHTGTISISGCVEI